MLSLFADDGIGEINQLIFIRTFGKNMIVSDETKEIIRSRIIDSIENLPEYIRNWLEDHLIEPVYVHVSENTEGDYNEFVIQVTGDVGKDDSSCHVYFNEEENKFGLILILENDFRWKMGLYGEFDITVWSM